MKETEKRALFPRAAGLMATAASLIVFAESLLFLNGASQTYVFSHANYYGWRVLGTSFFYYLVTGVFGVISFFLGLISAIFLLHGKRIKLSMFGLGLLSTCGVVVFLWVFIVGSSTLSGVLLASLLSLPILVPSILSIMLVCISKVEFSS